MLEFSWFSMKLILFYTFYKEPKKMKKYVIRMQKLGTNIIKKGTCNTDKIENLVQVLGKYGYHVINYYESSENDQIKMVNLGRE